MWAFSHTSAMENQTLPFNSTSEAKIVSIQSMDFDLLVALSILLFTILLAVLSTIFGRFLSWLLRVNTRVYPNPSSTRRLKRIQLIHLQSLLHSFDLIANFCSLFTPREKKYQTYSWCYGIKAWLVVGYVWSSVVLSNDSPDFTIFGSFFFIISGYMAFERSNPRTLLQLGIFVLDSWIQFISSIVATLCLSVLLVHLLKLPLSECGIQTWFKHLLLLSNLWNIEAICTSHLVYPALLFQLYLILCIPQYLLFCRKRNLAITFNILLIISFITLQFLLHYEILQKYAIFSSNWLLLEQNFFIGTLLPNLTLSKLSSRELLVDVTLLLLSTILAIVLNTTFDSVLQPMVDIIATLLQALIIYLLVRAPTTSFIKQFLSSPFTVVLGRLSYEIFLLTPLVIILNHSDFNKLQIFTGIVMQTFLLSIPVYILFRAPMKNLLKLLEKMTFRENRDTMPLSSIFKLQKIPSPEIKLKSFSISRNLN